MKSILYIKYKIIISHIPRVKLFRYIGLILLIILFIAPFYKIFSVNFVDGHDFLLHFHMIYVLEKYIKTGIILPRWLSHATYGYGSPVFTFMWGVPYYLGALLHMIGLTYSQVFKTLIILPNVLSGFGFFLWLKPKYGKFIAGVAALVWIWTPYRFLDSFIRNAIGELFFFAFFPFILFFLDSAKSKTRIILGSFFSALLIYSHQGLSLIGYPVLICYIIFQYTQNKQKILLKNQLFILGGGLLLTFFYWFPVIAYQHLLSIKEGRIKSIWFPPLLSLIRSKWEGGSVFEGRRLIMSFQIGLAQLEIIFLSHLYAIYFFIKRKKQDIYIFFWLIIFWVSLFFMQPLSKWFWVNIPLIINLQFPFRLLFFPMLTAAVLSGLILSKMIKSVRFLIGFLFILAVIIANRNHLGVLNKEINLNEFASYQGTYDVGGEKLPKYVKLKEIQENIEKYGIGKEFTVISGKGNIIYQKREDYLSRVEIEMESEGEVKVRRIYFPGWQIYLNGRTTENFEKGNGIILTLPKGKSNVRVEYKDPPLIIFSNMVSIISLGGLLLLLFSKKPTFLQ